MRVCLATAHAYPEYPPLALLYLKGQLVQDGVLSAGNVDILEFACDANPEELADRVVERAPDVVGLSCYMWNIRTLLAACRHIKQKHPSTCIVLGGPEVGPVARQVLERNQDVDCIVLSEGEFPFAGIVTARRDGKDIGDVKGICYRRSGELIETGEAPIVRDLNAIAAPYQFHDFDPRGKVICIETQRGCVFRCNFCFYNKDLSIRNRRFDLDRVKGEILHWLQQDILEIYLMDPIFNLNAARAKEICRFIAEHNHRLIPVHTEIWAEFVDEEMATLMRDANFRFLEVGLQTTDGAVLATVERRLKLSRFRVGIEHLKRAGLPFELQLIVGLPGDTRAKFRSSLNFAASLQPAKLAVFALLLLPGTELQRKANIMGIEYDPEPPYVVRSHDSMSATDIDYGRRLARAVERVGNLWTIRFLGRENGTTFADVIDEWLDWAGEHAAEDRKPDPAIVHAFVSHYCEKRSIPSAFYEKSIGLELYQEPVSARRPRQAVMA